MLLESDDAQCSIKDSLCLHALTYGYENNCLSGEAASSKTNTIHPF
ncbi:MAG TPA: hypothetical protein PKN84_01500 [Paludibacteraceae bacterium]|nr:hypothetical protein [Paludibacteraceae bacterium]